MSVQLFSCPSSSRPTLVTHSLTVPFIVRDSKPYRQNRNLAILRGVMYMEVDEMADMMMDMEVNKVADEVADKLADMVK